MKHRILIVDDDKELCALLKKYCEQETYLVDIAYNGSQSLLKVEENDYQLIILDVMLQEISGFSVLSEIRSQNNVTPILMLTAKDAESNKVKGLKLGADDYLTKPFGMKELMARIDSLVRRYTLLNSTSVNSTFPIKLQGMTIDVENRIVCVDERQIDLTAKEFNLLYFLVIHKGKIFTKKQLYSQVWKEDYVFDDSNIMSFISKLRKKIEPDPKSPVYIQTIRGVGYRFNQGAIL